MISINAEMYLDKLKWLQAHWIEILIVATLIMLAIKIVTAAFRKLVDALTHYPETKFGFKGILVFVDDSPQKKAFVNHKYQLAAKPDFIFKVGFNIYVIVEFKSRNAPIRNSDIAQLKASVLTARSQYNIVAGYIVTGRQTKRFDMGSNSAVYRDIKQLHKTARSIKNLGQCPRAETGPKCNNCGFRDSGEC